MKYSITYLKCTLEGGHVIFDISDAKRAFKFKGLSGYSEFETALN